MKLKEKFQRFWTLSGSRQGFTLVELIVVIAILAILAGVAIPVYNGYIKKAQTAADQTLLDSVNTSFVAACMENGISQYDVKSAVIPVNDNGTIGTTTNSGVSYFAGLSFDENVSANANEINASFAFYYDGNQAAAFNTMKGALVFNPETGMFGEDVNVALDYKGTTIYVPQSTISAMKSSSYANLTGAGLANSVSNLTGLIGADANLASDLETLLGGTDAAMALLTGYTGQSEEQLMTELTNTYGEDVDAFNAALNTMYANAAVLSVAETASGMDTDSLSSFLTTGSFSGNSDEKMAQAALAYGMYTAYINSDAYASESTYTEVTDILYAAQNDPNYAAYLQTEQAGTDMDAYLVALQTISDNSSSTDVTSSIVLNGFDPTANPELTALLTSMLGK